jgi:hypothetical protein
MPIFLALCRIAQCSICSNQWPLEGLDLPDKCVFCGSADWEFGPESRDSRFIRQGISRVRKSLNKGAKSRKRQEQGKKQWQGFKPKPV